MASLKSYEVYSALKKPLTHAVYLVYGPDPHKKQRVLSILEQYLKPIKKFNSDTFLNENAVLATELNQSDFFGGNPTLFIQDAQKLKQHHFLDFSLTSRAILEATELKPTSPLRKWAEQTAYCLAIPCFEETLEEKKALIQEDITSAKATITPSALTRIAESENPTNTLELCLLIEEKITEETLDKILNEKETLYSLKDFLNNKLPYEVFEKNWPILLYSLKNLKSISTKIKETSLDASLKTARPPLSFAAQKEFKAILSKTDPNAIKISYQNFIELLLKSRQNYGNAKEIYQGMKALNL